MGTARRGLNTDNSKLPSSSEVPRFDPAAALTSKSASRLKKLVLELLSTKTTYTAKTPARALGDLGLVKHGLFLVFYADDVATGADPPTEVVLARRELYSTTGGGGTVVQ